MPGGDAAGSHLVWQYEDAGNMAWSPAKVLLCQIGGKASLHVQATIRLLDRSPLTLDLSDEHGCSGPDAGEDVDRSALTPFRECDLSKASPAATSQESDNPFNHPSMTLVEQPIEGCTVPPDADP
jgi:hypothetical protein